MEKIEEALEKQITRGNCPHCPKIYSYMGCDYCGVNEEEIGSGEEYCELNPIISKFSPPCNKGGI